MEEKKTRGRRRRKEREREREKEREREREGGGGGEGEREGGRDMKGRGFLMHVKFNLQEVINSCTS